MKRDFGNSCLWLCVTILFVCGQETLHGKSERDKFCFRVLQQNMNGAYRARLSTRSGPFRRISTLVPVHDASVSRGDRAPLSYKRPVIAL
jgi:hypothetical protein